MVIVPVPVSAVLLRRPPVSAVASARFAVKVSLALLYEQLNQPEKCVQWAREACDELVPMDNPRAADALFALARNLWASGNDQGDVYFEEGRRMLAHTSEFSAAAKARRLEESALQFEQRGLRDAAAKLRADAAEKRKSVPVFAW